jgi:hypothetical protein
MKITIISLIALAAAPLAGFAADKEVQTPARVQTACQKCHHQQVALFVQGQGIAQEQQSSGPQTMTVSQAQTGQGGSITFFTNTGR